MKTYEIDPCAKPRMTRQDKNPYPPRNYKGHYWPRPIVAKYWDFKNRVRMKKIDFPEEGAHIIFHIKMSKSWTIKKKREMVGKFHKQVPDLDNLLKGLSDAVYGNDSVISDVRVSKIWGYKGKIQIGKI